ncbi:MAG: hypothetical protein IJY91_04305 [Oscillospiraceae bacterium]|nr:hypothetical protein [Oscillospiraceae bacterium]
MEKEKRSKKPLLVIVLIALAAAIFGLCLLLIPSGGEETPFTEPHDSTASTGATITDPSESIAPSTEATQPSSEPSQPPVDPGVHQHSYSSDVTPPTCTEEGYTTYTCACGDSYSGDMVSATGHQYTQTVTAPTCTQGGCTTYTCSCGDSYIGTPTDAVGHNWGQWTTVIAPTETTEGNAERICAACGSKENRKLDKIIPDHTHSYTGKVTNAPTCSAEGVRTYTCSCGSSYTESIKKLSHSYTDQVTRPTCTAQGYTTHTCTVCSHSYTDNKTPAAGHIYRHTVTKPTCTTDGYTTHTCTVCAHSYTDGKTAALGHSYSVTAITEATCIADGSKTYTCSQCGDSYREAIPGGHKYQTTVTNPTCTEAGFTTYFCSVCKDSYTGDAVAATGHSWGRWQNVWPTCTTDGYSYRSCACGAQETEAGSEAYGHSYSVSAEKDGRLIYSCWRCSDSYSENIPTRHDASLAVPEVASVHPGSLSFDINCYADFADDSGFGYQCLIARDADFTKELMSDKENSQWNDLGFVKFAYFYVRGSYYYKVRAYKMEGDTFVYGDWSEPAKVSCMNYNTMLNKQAQYSYDIYFVDNLGSDVYTECFKPVYIKTDNPSGDSIRLTANGESVLGSIIMWGKAEYYDDVEYLDITDYDSLLHKVPGGYLGILKIETSGKLTVQVQETSPDGYVVAKTFKLNVLDYDTERNKWIDDVIASQTNSSMTPKEKMDAIAKFLSNGQFKYPTNVNGELVTLAGQPNSPWFLSKRWDSATSPAMLAVFAERIGGFEEIHNCYADYPRGTSEWYQYHHQTYVVYEGQKYYYTVCPYTPTGDVGSVAMIDFSRTSDLTFVA